MKVPDREPSLWSSLLKSISRFDEARAGLSRVESTALKIRHPWPRSGTQLGSNTNNLRYMYQVLLPVYDWLR